MPHRVRACVLDDDEDGFDEEWLTDDEVLGGTAERYDGAPESSA